MQPGEGAYMGGRIEVALSVVKQWVGVKSPAHTQPQLPVFVDHTYNELKR